MTRTKINIYALIILIRCIHMNTQKEQIDTETNNKKLNSYIDSEYINI